MLLVAPVRKELRRDLTAGETQLMAGGVERMVATSDNMARQSREGLEAAASAKVDAEKGRATVQESRAIMQRLESAAREAAEAVQRHQRCSRPDQPTGFERGHRGGSRRGGGARLRRCGG